MPLIHLEECISMWQGLLTEKSIFALFPDEVLKTFPVLDYVRKVKASEVLIAEGILFHELCIPLSAPLNLTTRKNTDPHAAVGTIQVGRSANLFSFLRMLPSQYSIVSESDCEVLMIPRAKIDHWLEKYPELKNYIFKTSESTVFRSLLQDLRYIGLSQNFTTQLIAKLEETDLLPHTYLCHTDQPAAAAFLLLEGKFLYRQDKTSQSSWIAPLKTWVGWNSSVLNQPDELSVLSLTKSNCLSIKAEDLRSLKNLYAADFEIMNKWVVDGQFHHFDRNEETEIVDNVVDLFEGSIQSKRWKWNYPWIQQNDKMDCGPACLAMVSEYFDKDLGVHFWRSKLSTDRTGTSLYDLAKTTENAGFISHCLEVENLEEVDQFLLPFIALRKYHYVVVYKIKKNSVIIGDPGAGISEMSFSEFYDGFEKVGLFLKPTAEFLEHEETPSKWRHYIQLFQGLKSDMLLALTCSVLGVLVSLIPPIISQIALDDVMVQKDVDLLWWLIGTALGACLIAAFIKWAESYYFVYIMSKFNFRASSVFVQKMLSLPYQFFAQRHVGDFTHRLNEMAHLRNFVTGTLFGSVLNLITMVIYGCALFFINSKAAVLVLGLAPFYFLAPILTSNYLSKLYAQIFTKASAQSSFVTDIIRGVAAIKSSGAEMAARFRFEKRSLSLIKTQNQFAMTAVNIQTFTMGYNQFANVLILGFTVYMGISGEMSAGKVISFSLIANRVFIPLVYLAQQWDQFVEMKSVLSRLNDIFLAPSDQVQEKVRAGKMQLTSLRGEIEFKDVWFRYGGEASDWALKGINLKIEKGQKVAIVGPSGSGKSTLAHLLTRMYTPTKGQIFIDGKDYREYDVNWLRTQVGLLHQENYLFEGNFADNIALSENEIDEDRFLRALEKASASEFVQKKGGPYSYIPHGGIGFSGGEKQKIVLARLFYQNPSIVVLDEATSSLDGIAEANILEQIRVEMKNQTVLSIAHRISTVQSSDYALVLWDGKVVDFGALEYLKSSSNSFQKLFNLPISQKFVGRAS